MSLTVEQKINLLILAGFEPAAYEGDASYYPRIVMGNREGIPSLWRNGDNKWRFDPTILTERDPVSWGDIDMEEIPDELIFQAIGAVP